MIPLRFRMNALELASGLLFGNDPAIPALPEPSHQTARVVLEALVLGALRRPPSFSGGRDSSAILAVATQVARSHGLPLPVPVTLRFPGMSDTDESVWQESVVRYLGLTDWVRLEFADDLDLVGPVAQGVLRRHGLVWPFNAHFHVPALEYARAGALLTGVGGDEIFLPGRWLRAMLLLRLRTRPRQSDLPVLAAALMPRRLRAAWLLRREGVQGHWEWLRPAAARRVEIAWATNSAGDPLRWDRWIHDRWWPGRRRSLGSWILSRLAADVDAVAVNPFEDPLFLSTLAREFGSIGFRSRTEAMRALFDTTVPDQLLSRSTKASFDPALWNRHARAFAESWHGTGLDSDLVDLEALRSTWRSDPPPALTFSLLQAAWMHSAGLSLGGQLVE
jgi:asparagine synthase (glutamine-hydrolysing)